MGQYQDEMQAIRDTYLEPGDWYKPFLLQQASNQIWQRLADEAYWADSETVFQMDGNLYPYEEDFYIKKAYASATKEDFYRAWCDSYYAVSGDPSLREE